MNMKSLIVLFGLMLSTTGCVSAPVQPQTPPIAEGVYGVLMAENYRASGEYLGAAQWYLREAERYKDKRLAKLAMDNALSAQDMALTQQAHAVWSGFELDEKETKQKDRIGLLLAIYSQDNEALSLYAKAYFDEHSTVEEKEHLLEWISRLPDRDRVWHTMMRLSKLFVNDDTFRDFWYAYTLVYGRLLIESEGYQRASMMMSAFVKVHDNVEAKMILAMWLMNLEDYDAAEIHLKEIVEVSPEDPEALNALGYLYVEQERNLSKAQALLEKALSLSNEFHIKDSYGWLMFKKGDYAQAEQYLKSALNEKFDVEIALHLVELYYVTHQGALANELVERLNKDFADHPRWLKERDRMIELEKK